MTTPLTSALQVHYPDRRTRAYAEMEALLTQRHIAETHPEEVSLYPTIEESYTTATMMCADLDEIAAEMMEMMK
jgi:hypothetical protein